jgi:hypothetical protein
MRNSSITLKVLACAIFILALSSLAQAQATRTWVSGVGNDANPCSRTAPCKTWAGAISKTAAGGEMNALDPGGYGTLTITKSITIDGGGSGWASTLASATNGFTIDDSATATPNTIVVHLRNISINGAGTTLGVDGIRFLSGKALYVENVRISRFSGDGIEMTTGTNGLLYVKDSFISECGGDGLRMTSNVAGRYNTAVLENVEFSRCGNGVNVTDRSRLTMRGGASVLNSTAVAGNSAGLKQGGGANDIISHLIGVNLSHNGTGIIANGGAARVSNIYITNCGTSISTPGNVASWGDNMIRDNGVNNQPGAPTLIKQ